MKSRKTKTVSRKQLSDAMQGRKVSVKYSDRKEQVSPQDAEKIRRMEGGFVRVLVKDQRVVIIVLSKEEDRGFIDTSKIGVVYLDKPQDIHGKIKRAQLVKLVKGRSIYVTIMGTEVQVRIPAKEAEYLRNAVDGDLLAFVYPDSVHLEYEKQMPGILYRDEE